MDDQTLKAFFRKQIEEAKSDYLKDLESMSQEQLASTPSDKARSAYDFTYEVVYVNRRIAKRLRGESVPPAEDNGWMRAPEEFRNKESAKQEMEASMDEILGAWDNYPNPLDAPIQLAKGETNALNLGFMAAHHASYHDAQLNYLQSLSGNDQVHW